VLIGEVGLPPARAARYFRHVQIPLNFGLITRPWTADRIARRITAHLDALPAGAWPNWVLGSHDVSRVATRLGPQLARAAAVVLLTLPGTVTLYYGDELGLTDAPVDSPSRDRLGEPDPARSRDPQRAPMPWDATAGAGFSRGRPWLPIHPDASRLSVQGQAADAGSTLTLYKELLRLRREHAEIARSPLEALRSEGGVLSYRRGRFHVSANLSAIPAPAPSPVGRRPVIDSQPTIGPEHGIEQLMLAPGQAVVLDPS
jgi:alpha-glucosidase